MIRILSVLTVRFCWPERIPLPRQHLSSYWFIWSDRVRPSSAWTRVSGAGQTPTPPPCASDPLGQTRRLQGQVKGQGISVSEVPGGARETDEDEEDEGASSYLGRRGRLWAEAEEGWPRPPGEREPGGQATWPTPPACPW